MCIDVQLKIDFNKQLLQATALRCFRSEMMECYLVLEDLCL